LKLFGLALGRLPYCRTSESKYLEDVYSKKLQSRDEHIAWSESMAFITSEIGKLKKVLLSHPKIAIERLTPENCHAFLFDDILFIKEAEKEHDHFAAILKENGVEVLYLDELLEETLKIEKARKWVVERILASYNFELPFVQDLSHFLMELEAKQLTYHMMAGLTLREAHFKRKGLIFAVGHRDEFLLPPLPNQYFTRDPSCWIGNGVSINRMQYKVRRGECISTAAVYKHHPLFASENLEIWYDGTEKDCSPVEGGDVFVLNKNCLMIGYSERTSIQAIETLTLRLFAKSAIDRVVLVELPKKRACMHLDTVMTMIDHDAFCVAFKDFAPRTFTIQPRNTKDLLISEEMNLQTALQRALKISNVRFISIGDIENEIVQLREQWMDASNLLAIAPGKVIGYACNERTNSLLRSKGFEVLELVGSELGRGRGGSRCMSCPIEREPL